MRRFVPKAFAMILGLSLQATAAGELPGAGGEFLIDVWTSDDGLPQNSVIAMAQTKEGYLWMSTFSGLARFDGKRFDPFAGAEIPELAGEVYFRNLGASAEGDLWMRGKQVLARKDGVFRLIGQSDGLPSSGLTAWESAPDGTLWIGDGAGQLLKETNGRFVVVKDAPPAPDWGPITRLRIEPSGAAWTWRSNEFVRFKDGQWSSVFHLDGGAEVATAEVSRDGARLWISLSNPRRLMQYSNGTLSGLGPIGSDPKSSFGSYFILEDAAGNLWLPGQHELFRYGPDGRWSELSAKDGFPSDEVRSAFLDREGNVWFGTDGGGVARIKRRAARSYGAAEGMHGKVVLSVAGEDTNNLWLTVLSAGLHHFNGTSLTFLGDPANLEWTVLPDSKGNLWVGTYSRGLFCRRAGETNHQTWTSADTPGLLAGPIISLYEAGNGDIWIGGGHGGVSRYANGQFQCWPMTKDFDANPINALCEDAGGAVWIGAANGLFHIQGQEIKRFVSKDGLAGDDVHALYKDSRGSLWIGGYELTRFKDGRFARVRRGDGLAANNIESIIEDNEGCLWLSTQHGILRVSLRDLNKFCDARTGRVEFDVFTKADGLPSNECSGVQPAVWKDSAGRLWYPTLNGLAVIDPARLSKNNVLPPVAIESVVADDKVLPQPGPTASKNGALRVPAGTSRLEFRFVALSFSAPEKNRYQYRLDPFDEDWSREGTSQSAAYTLLPPGEYIFRVRACNNDGVWNATGAALPLAVLPFFWQTKWFQAAVLAAAAGGIWWSFRFRLRQVEGRRLAQAAFARQVIESQEAERQRIARELHDGVGQQLLLVKSRLSTVLRKAEPTPFLQENLGQASHDVGQALEEIRATAHALRPAELDRLGLCEALESMLERAEKNTTIRISKEFDDVKKAVSKEVEVQLYRIAQEAINNVVKYSRAAEVNVSLKREGRRLTLAVQDDGVGFDPAAQSRKDGFGLSSMAERARLIGGEFAVMSAPGSGCRLTVTMPLGQN